MLPHDLLRAKLSAYGFNGNALEYIYMYLKNCKQWVPVNNLCNDFKDIISRVPQGSVIGPILFNGFLDDFFFCIRKASVHKFVDDNMLPSFAISVTLLVEIFMAESQLNGFLKRKCLLTLTNLNPLSFKKVIKQAKQF